MQRLRSKTGRGHGGQWLIVLAWVIAVYLFVPLTTAQSPLGVSVIELSTGGEDVTCQ